MILATPQMVYKTPPAWKNWMERFYETGSVWRRIVLWDTWEQFLTHFPAQLRDSQ